MKKNGILIIGIVLLVAAAALMINSAYTNQPESVATQNASQPASQSTSPHAEHARNTKPIPAFFAAPPSKSSLAPTLEPAQFTGPVRDAYRAVREIPVTIAQLPCYCHCDEGFGHKSLYSCFQDDHAAHCAVCVQEALMALKLEKDQKMTPAQIRDTIIAQYSH
jgi:Protein of unknown function with PCYCGC motif